MGYKPIDLNDSLAGSQIPTMERSFRNSDLPKPKNTTNSLKKLYGAGAPLNPRTQQTEERSLSKSLLNVLDGSEDSVERLAFEIDPRRVNDYMAVYRPKLQGIPDSLLKRIAIQDDLVAAIVHTRANHVSQFGRKQIDRHSMGYKFMVDDSVIRKLDKEKQDLLDKRIHRMEKILENCGFEEGVNEQDKCSFTEYLYMTVRNELIVGRSATEIIHSIDNDLSDESDKRFHSFRPADAGTIYFAAPYSEEAQSVRDNALQLLERLKNEKFVPERFKNQEYAWIQVLDGSPTQAFTNQEMLVHSPYNVTDIEQLGYPITPVDTILSAVTTHINISHHNRLYFQTGRAARGMLIIKSADIDPDIVNGIKQQFNASINSVQNAWRMPVFGIGEEDEIDWRPIEVSGSRDMEFQFLTDANARTILAAFQMSPEELPGYGHLSRGTNSQALSESNEEYKLTAARDVGIRPLISNLEDFINKKIIPLIDKELSVICKLKFLGLDAETEEKESVRIQQDMSVWMSFNDILSKLEKPKLGKHLASEVPLNSVYFQYLQLFVPFGTILEDFLGIEGAKKDPNNQFYMNPFWQQNQQTLVQKKAMEMQQKAMDQKGGASGKVSPQGPDAGGGGSEGGSGSGKEASGASTSASEGSSSGQGQGQGQGQPSAEGSPFSSGIDKLGEMAKGEKGFPDYKNKLREHVLEANKKIMENFNKNLKEKIKEISDSILDGIDSDHAK